jgi:signal transduction histidine kinase
VIATTATLHAPAPGPIKFLVVDDAASTLEATRALLQRDGLEIHCASSGAEALELLLVHEYALALIDVHMPGMGGIELAEVMRSTDRTRSIPIMFVTGDGSDPGREFRGYDAGAVAYLTKPVAPHVLRNKAATFFELALQRQVLQQLAGELRETLKLNETFVAAVTHDLRSPLSTVSMGVELLVDPVTDSRARDAAAAMVRTSVARMQGMIDALTDLARARLSGGILVEPTRLDLHALARDLVAEARGQHPHRRIELWAAGDPWAKLDRSQIGRVLANLIGNALTHGDASQPIHVAVDGTEDARVLLEVHNTGVIPEQSMPHLFEPFWRGRKSRGDSLGLGLYIVQQITIAHGGAIEVHSDDVAGTRFVVSLPRAR